MPTKRSYPGLSGRILIATILMFLGLVVGIALLEVLLTVVGRSPRRYSRIDINEPIMYEPDRELGWRSKRGSYIVPRYAPSGQDIKMTFVENGRRLTGENPAPHSNGQLVLVGDSLTQGWAISDDETFAWKLQKMYPFLEVLNYGTAGYSTYQSLLVLERELPHLAQPKLVLYGFVEFHEFRNVAAGEWLAQLSSLSRRGDVDVPYVTVDAEKRLVGHPPERYLRVPFREWSALAFEIGKAYMKFKTRDRISQRTLATEQTLLRMKEVSAERSTPFAVVLLMMDRKTNQKEHYLRFLKENKIPAIDCDLEFTNEMKVPGEGHPNGKMNTLWAECISNKVKDQLTDEKFLRTSTPD